MSAAALPLPQSATVMVSRSEEEAKQFSFKLLNGNDTSEMKSCSSDEYAAAAMSQANPALQTDRRRPSIPSAPSVLSPLASSTSVKYKGGGDADPDTAYSLHTASSFRIQSASNVEPPSNSSTQSHTQGHDSLDRDVMLLKPLQGSVGERKTMDEKE